MKRPASQMPTTADWLAQRIAYESGETKTLASVSKALGVGQNTVSIRARSEGWARGGATTQMAVANISARDADWQPSSSPMDESYVVPSDDALEKLSNDQKIKYTAVGLFSSFLQARQAGDQRVIAGIAAPLLRALELEKTINTGQGELWETEEGRQKMDEFLLG